MKKLFVVLTALMAAGAVQADHYYWRGNFYGGDGVTWDVPNVNNFLHAQSNAAALFLPDGDDHVIIDESWVNGGGGTMPIISTNVGAVAYLTPGWGADTGVATVTIEDGGNITANSRYWLGAGSNTVSFIYMKGGYMVGNELAVSDNGAGYVDMSGDSVLHVTSLVVGTAEGRIRMRDNAWFLVNGDHTATGTGNATNWINNGTITGLGTIAASYNSVDGRTEFVVTDPVYPEYVFFDDFNTGGADNANTDIINRQATGMVASPYRYHPQHFGFTNIASNGKLNDYWNGAFAVAEADLADYIVGKDFEFSCKVAVHIPDGQWSSIYLCDEDGKERGNSRLGMYIPGAEQGWACVLYHGTGAAQEALAIDPNWYGGLAGYDKSQEHTFQFVSVAGAGGTNSYDLFIDGVEITDSAASGGNAPDSLQYYFDGDHRRIGIVGVQTLPASNDPTEGSFYDDVALKVFKGTTYEDWVVDDTGLTVGVNDARTDNPDLDSMDNLLEYSLGGNPLVDDDATILPTTDYSVVDTLKYIYNRRTDHAPRGLDYGVTLTVDDLTLGTWTNYGAAFESGSALINAEFESVTNALSIGGVDMGFVNLEVKEY